jgi:hypothetical protein
MGKKFILKKIIYKPGMGAHACNPTYSGSKGKSISSLRPAQEKLARPYFKKTK